MAVKITVKGRVGTLTEETLWFEGLEMEEKEVKVSQVNISEITPDDHNANQGTKRGQAMLNHSLQTYGAGRSILLDKNNKIIAGNQTTAEAGVIGMEDVIVVETTGDQLVAVKRTDLDLDDPNARMLAYADNRVSSVNLDFNPEVLAEDVKNESLDFGPFFTDMELDFFANTDSGESLWQEEKDNQNAAETEVEKSGEQNEKYVLKIHCGSAEEIEELAEELESRNYKVIAS